MGDETSKKVPVWLGPTIAAVGLIVTVGGSYVVQRVQNEARHGAIERQVSVLETRLNGLEGELQRRLEGIEKDVDAIGVKIDRLLEARLNHRK